MSLFATHAFGVILQKVRASREVNEERNKELGRMWNALSEEQRRPYEDLAALDKQRHAEVSIV